MNRKTGCRQNVPVVQSQPDALARDSTGNHASNAKSSSTPFVPQGCATRRRKHSPRGLRSLATLSLANASGCDGRTLRVLPLTADVSGHPQPLSPKRGEGSGDLSRSAASFLIVARASRPRFVSPPQNLRIGFLSAIFAIFIGVCQPTSVGLLTAAESRSAPAPAAEKEKAAGSKEIDARLTQALLADLHSPSYRTRREAFLKLCDRDYPIDDWLQSEVSSPNPHDASLAAWLTQLRRTDGPLSDRLEVLTAYQRASQGDDSALYQFILGNRWDRVLEVLEILPPQSQLAILKDQAGLARYVELAWGSGNEWAVPKLLNIVVGDEERVPINRWWRDLGMPDDWKLDEPDTPIVHLSRLEADGKWKEAIRFAHENRMPEQLGRLHILGGDWAGWLQLNSEEREHRVGGGTPFEQGGRDMNTQRLIAHLLLGKMDDAKLTWQRIKEDSQGISVPGFLTLALAMNDQDAFKTHLGKIDQETTFDVQLFQRGSLKDAFAVKGLTDLESKEGKKSWAKGQLEKLFQIRGHEAIRRDPARDPLRTFLSAIHQSGDDDLQQAADEVCAAELKKDSHSTGSVRSRDLLMIWSTGNQRSKGTDYLRNLSLEKKYPLTVFGKRSIQEESESTEEPCFQIVFGRNLVEPYLIYEYLVREAMTLPGASPEDAINRSFDLLDDLYYGRKPKEWEDLSPLKDLVMGVRKRILELHRDDGSFCSSMASLFETMGDTNEAIGMLQDWTVSRDSHKQLALLLEKAGKADLAGKILARYQGTTLGRDNYWYLETTRLLELGDQIEELDRLRRQQFALVHTLPYLVASPFYSPIPEELIQRSPDVPVLLEKWRRLSPLRMAHAESVVRYMRSKEDISCIVPAYRASCISLFVRSADLLRVGEQGTRTLLMNALPILVLHAIHEKDQVEVDRWLRMAHRIEPTQIQLPIDVLPWADKVFPREVVDAWFDLYYDSMVQSIEAFPEDAVTLNNTAWLCAICDRKMDKAKEFADRAVAKRYDPTYLDTLAEVEFRLGKVVEAIEISQRCREMEPREAQHKQQIERFVKELNVEHE